MHRNDYVTRLLKLTQQEIENLSKQQPQSDSFCLPIASVPSFWPVSTRNSSFLLLPHAHLPPHPLDCQLLSISASTLDPSQKPDVILISWPRLSYPRSILLCAPAPVSLRNNWHCTCLRRAAWWLDLHWLWNQWNCRSFSWYPSSCRQNKKKKGKIIFSLWWELLGFTVSTTFL